jgi:hypothetical protein
MPTPTPMRAASLLDTFGVNVRLEYTDSKYANVGKVISALKYIGIDNLRDGAVLTSTQTQAKQAYNAAAAAGFKFDMVVNSSDLKGSTASIAAWAAAHPGSLNAIEGPNEINISTFKYAGVTGGNSGVMYQADLTAAIRADKRLDGVATYAITGPHVTTASDYLNSHPYPRSGAQPWNTLAGALKGLAATTPGKGMVLTEFGYYSAPNSSNWGGVDQASQAKMELNGLLDATLQGASRTYLYQLLDAYSDPTGVSVEKNMGLFDFAGNPKMVATALHNLTTLLADHATGATTFNTDPLAYTLKNMPTTGHTMIVEKSTGEHDILLWAEPNIWNNTTHTAIVAPTSQITVDFGKEHHAVAIFDPLISSTTPVASYADVTSVKVAVTDHPVIVEVFDIGHGWVASNHI